jgi:hypothetical protein
MSHKKSKSSTKYENPSRETKRKAEERRRRYSEELVNGINSSRESLLTSESLDREEQLIEVKKARQGLSKIYKTILRNELNANDSDNLEMAYEELEDFETENEKDREESIKFALVYLSKINLF